MASAYSNPRQTLASSRPLAGAFRLDVKTRRRFASYWRGP
jgi:hypothetical protein